MKKMRHYDFVYLTNTPSFYKLNLCDEIGKTGVKILIVLYGYGSEAVNTVLSNSLKCDFDFEFINTGDANTRNKVMTFLNLLKLMRTIKTKKILYAGWLAPEYNLFSFLSPKKKNIVICESSELDVNFRGINGWIKKRIIGRMSGALPSGKPHLRLFQNIDFKGTVSITGSVGIFHKPKRQIKSTYSKPLKFLYVGRLIEVKQVSLLVEVFNSNGLPLTIVGKGQLENSLKEQANSNITFKGFVDNDLLGEIYQQHDVFILPSKYEPWGLVVEEAIYWGLPVIVSNKVGSKEDMVADLGTGIIFDNTSKDALQKAIEKMAQTYDLFKKNVDNVNFIYRDINQVKAYTNLLK